MKRRRYQNLTKLERVSLLADRCNMSYGSFIAKYTATEIKKMMRTGEDLKQYRKV